MRKGLCSYTTGRSRLNITIDRDPLPSSLLGGQFETRGEVRQVVLGLLLNLVLGPAVLFARSTYYTP
jgi:hypothetical protein